MKILLNGADPDQAKYWVLLLHGRGAGADDILGLSMEFEPHPDVCWLAPEANGLEWYPGKIGHPRRSNEPFLTVSLESLRGLIEKFPSERLIIGGFSQGACLVSEFLTREPKRYGGAWIFSGGFLGVPEDKPELGGDLAGTPVVISGSEHDPHIPLARMKETEAAVGSLGAEVSSLFYPGSTHTVTSGEVELAKANLATLLASAQP